MRSSVALVYLRRFSPERGLSLRAAILSLANRLSHLLTRAGRVFIFKAIFFTVQSAGSQQNYPGPFHSALFGFRTTHPTQKGLFLLGRKPNLRSRSAHTTYLYNYYSLSLLSKKGSKKELTKRPPFLVKSLVCKSSEKTVNGG